MLCKYKSKWLSYFEFSVSLTAISISSFSHRSSKSLLKDLSYSARHESWAVVPIKICRSSGGTTILVGSCRGTTLLVIFQGPGASEKVFQPKLFTFDIKHSFNSCHSFHVFSHTCILPTILFLHTEDFQRAVVVGGKPWSFY